MVSSYTGIYFSWASSSSNEGFPTSLCKRHRPIEARRHLWRLSSPTPAQGRGSCSRLLRAVSSWVFSFSEDGDSTSSSVSMCQGLTTLTTRKLLSPCISFSAQGTYLPVADVCCPLYGRVAQYRWPQRSAWRCHEDV